MEPTIIIPTNYTDAGKLLGMFEIRNVVECFVLCLPLTLLSIFLSPFGLTGTIILVMVLDITAGGFALIGMLKYKATVTGILLDKDRPCGKTLEPFCDKIYHSKDITEEEIAQQILRNRA